MLQTSHVLPHCSRHTFADLTMESTLSVFCRPKTVGGNTVLCNKFGMLKTFYPTPLEVCLGNFCACNIKIQQWKMPWTRSTVLPLSQNVSVAMPAVISVGKPSGQRRTSNVVQALKKKSLPKAGKKLWDWIWLNCLLETPSSPVSDVHCKKKTSLTKPCSFGFCLEFPRILLSKNSGRLDWTTPRATSTFGMKHFTQMTI